MTESNNNGNTGDEIPGFKKDDGKLRWDLLPIEPIEKIIKVMMYGSKKYSDDNWKRIDDPLRRYYSAALRHLTAWQKGEKRDSETGESHLAHAACCVVFMLWHEMNQK